MKINQTRILLSLFVIYMIVSTIYCEVTENTLAKLGTKEQNGLEKKKETIRKIIIKVPNREHIFQKIEEIKKKIAAIGEYHKIEFRYGEEVEVISRSDFENNLNSFKNNRLKLNDNNKIQRVANMTNPINNSTYVNPINTTVPQQQAKNVVAAKQNNPKQGTGVTVPSVGQQKQNTNVQVINNAGKNVKQPIQKKPANKKIPIGFRPVIAIKPNPFAQITNINVINYYLHRVENLKNQPGVAYPIIQVKKQSPRLLLVLQDLAKF
jgi:hypothetical protein